MIRAILMDFNGVVINDEPLQLKAYQDVLRDEGIEVTADSYYSLTGTDDATFLKHHFKNAGKELTDEKIDEVIERKMESWRGAISNGIPICDGVEAFLKKCQKRFAIGLVSMANRREINFVLENTGLGEFFDVVISSEDVSENKPSPECYLTAFRQLDALRNVQGHYPMLHKECVVIEDVPQGIRAGKEAGMQALGVTNTFDEKILRSAGADAVTHSLTDWFPDSVIRVFSRI